MTTIVNPSDTPRAPYVIQMNDSLHPERVVPCTPGVNDSSNYKQIDDDTIFSIATGHWSTNLFASYGNLVPNGLMAALCPCVSLAQITSRLGLLPFSTALLSFGILCSLELIVFVLIVVQFIVMAGNGHNGSGHHDYGYLDNGHHDYGRHDHGHHGHGHNDSIHHNHGHHDHGHGNDGGHSALNPVLLVVVVLTHSAFITALWLLRKRIRNQFQIPGSNIVDGVSVTCCPCFSTAQMATHIKSYQPGSCSFGPVDTLPHYQ